MGQPAEGQPILAADPAGDNALKANNTTRAERYYQQARNIDNTDSYAVLGLGDAAAARKDNDAAERYYRRVADGQRQQQRGARSRQYLSRAVSGEGDAVYSVALCQPAPQH